MTLGNTAPSMVQALQLESSKDLTLRLVRVQQEVLKRSKVEKVP